MLPAMRLETPRHRRREVPQRHERGASDRQPRSQNRAHAAGAGMVIDRAAALPEIMDQLLVARDRRSGAEFFRHEAPEGSCAAMTRRNFNRRQHFRNVLVRPKALKESLGWAKGSGDWIITSPVEVGRQLDRPSDRPGNGSGVSRGRSPSLGSASRRPACKAACWAVEIGAGAEEATTLIDAERQRARAGQHILQADLQLAPPGPEAFIQRRHLHAPGVVDSVMVLHAGADIRVVVQHQQAQRLEQTPRRCPESWRSCGELMAPPDTMFSPPAP